MPVGYPSGMAQFFGATEYSRGDPEWAEGWRHSIDFAHRQIEGVIFISYPLKTKWVAAGRGRIPQKFEATINSENLDVDVVLDFEADDGVPVCTAVQFRTKDSTYFSANTLRSVPFMTFERMARLAAVRNPQLGPIRQSEVRTWSELLLEDIPEPTGRGVPLADEHFRTVATVYREAMRTGESTTKAVAIQVAGDIRRTSTAGRWVNEARNRGFLAPTTKGKKGESAQTRESKGKRR